VVLKYPENSSESMQATFRLAGPADLDLLLIFNREFCAFDQHPFDEATLRPALDQLLRDNSLGRVWLIQYGAQAIGYLGAGVWLQPGIPWP